jgi:hypothetical protein
MLTSLGNNAPLKPCSTFAPVLLLQAVLINMQLIVVSWFLAGRSASHPELFVLAGADRTALPEDPAPAPGTQEQQHELQAALTQKVVAKAVQAKQAEVEGLVAGVAAKFGLTADYGKAEETIKAVWAEQASFWLYYLVKMLQSHWPFGNRGVTTSAGHPSLPALSSRKRPSLHPRSLPPAGIREKSTCWLQLASSMQPRRSPPWERAPATMPLVMKRWASRPLAS